jgi:carboxyl-terminal processing protease
MVKNIFKTLLVVGGIVLFATFARSQVEKAPAKDPVQTEKAPLKDPAKEALPAAVGEDEKDKDADVSAGDLYAQVELFSYALTTVQSEYVEEKKPKDIIYGALTGMLSSLDPYSQFLTPADYKELKTETEGKFGGLGIEIAIRDGLLTIVTPIEDTPAWKVGLKAGDRIVKIGKDITKDMTLNDAVKKLRGEPGTAVHITVLRESEFKLHEFDITREIIHIQDVKEPHIIADGVGYVRLVEFREDSYTQILKALEKLKADGATSLILDLRNNPGGLLNVAIDISEIFLPKGMTIVSTKGRHPAQDTVSVSQNGKGEFADWPVVVLINEGSASGSEILAGALKDNKRAVTLGVKSFGKGSVQSVIPLPDGSGLRLTTAKYYTPSGISIHEIGITPDIVIERIYPKGDDEGDEDAEAKDEAPTKVKEVKKDKKNAKGVFEKMEEEGADPNEVAKKRKEASMKKRMAEDNQVQAAISVIKGIQVYKKLMVK